LENGVYADGHGSAEQQRNVEQQECNQGWQQAWGKSISEQQKATLALVPHT
jgi:hypothetical protein